MNRLLVGTGVAVLLGPSTALAAEDSNMTATQPGVSQETSKQAHQPSSGSADTLGARPSRARRLRRGVRRAQPSRAKAR